MLKDDLLNDKKWLEFLEYKLDKEFLNDKEKKELEIFISSKKYMLICNSIVNNSYSFSIPKKHVISKGNSNKKIIVYTYSKDEMIILKYISYLLYEYDYLFSPNLYSFRKNTSVKEAIRNLCNIKNLNNMYGYKVDISNYFNSINVEILLKDLKENIYDKMLYDLFYNLLCNEYVIYNKEKITEKKGAMAGTPISAFLANYYIKEIDEYFWNQQVVYMRYADDIIMFCNNKDELDKNVNKLKEFINKYMLVINEAKKNYYLPKEEFEFLGFSIKNKQIDLSKNTIRKIKAKIRRSARGIRRWSIRKNAKFQSALKAMNRKYNRKFFGKEEKNQLSWKCWFFPTINTSKSLKIIDSYMQNYQRYIVTRKI